MFTCGSLPSSILSNTQMRYILRLVAVHLGNRNVEHKPVATTTALCNDRIKWLYFYHCITHFSLNKILHSVRQDDYQSGFCWFHVVRILFMTNSSYVLYNDLHHTDGNYTKITTDGRRIQNEKQWYYYIRIIVLILHENGSCDL